MHRALRALVLLATLGVLVAILVFVASLCRNGLHISYSGDVRVLGMPEEIKLRFGEPVLLSMPGGTTLSATVSGAQTAPVTLALAAPVCPTCGAAMLPVRFNLLSGKIEWACPQCASVAP